LESTGSNTTNWDDFTIKSTVRHLLAIQDTAGIVIKVALLGGMERQEMLYVHRQDICNSKRCDCQSLHVINADMDLTMISDRQSDCHYLGLVPQSLWKSFRTLRGFNIGDIGIANMISDVTCGIEFDGLRELYHCVILGGMERSEAAILINPSLIETSNLIWDEADFIAKNACKAWQRLGVTLTCR
jgi:hypothetical protein